MKDKINIHKDELIILAVPADPKKDIKMAHEGRKLTLAEWKKFFPKPQFKWNKE